MPDRDPLPEFCRYSLWKEYEGCGWTDTENADTAEIVAGADWRDDAWIA